MTSKAEYGNVSDSLLSLEGPNIVEPVVKWALHSDRNSSTPYERQVCRLNLDFFKCLQCPSYLHAPPNW